MRIKWIQENSLLSEYPVHKVQSFYKAHSVRIECVAFEKHYDVSEELLE